MQGSVLPPPAYSADIGLGALTTAERLLVITVRLLVLPRSATGERADWNAGLRAAGVEACAAPALEALFRVVAAAQRRPLDIRCPCRHALGEDEARQLQMVSLFQHARDSEAEAILTDWLPPAAQRLASLPAQVLSAAMERQRLLIPIRTACPTRPVTAFWAARGPSYSRLQ